MLDWQKPGSVIHIGYAPAGVSSSGPLVIHGELYDDPYNAGSIESLINKGWVFIRTVVTDE